MIELDRGVRETDERVWARSQESGGGAGSPAPGKPVGRWAPSSPTAVPPPSLLGVRFVRPEASRREPPGVGFLGARPASFRPELLMPVTLSSVPAPATRACGWPQGRWVLPLSRVVPGGKARWAANVAGEAGPTSALWLEKFTAGGKPGSTCPLPPPRAGVGRRLHLPTPIPDLGPG